MQMCVRKRRTMRLKERPVEFTALSAMARVPAQETWERQGEGESSSCHVSSRVAQRKATCGRTSLIVKQPASQVLQWTVAFPLPLHLPNNDLIIGGLHVQRPIYVHARARIARLCWRSRGRLPLCLLGLLRIVLHGGGSGGGGRQFLVLNVRRMDCSVGHLWLRATPGLLSYITEHVIW